MAVGDQIQPRQISIGDDTSNLLRLGVVDEYGSSLYCNDLTGWDGGSGTTLTSDQKASDDGAWLSAAYLPAKVMAAEIEVIAPSKVAVLLSLRQILGRSPLRRPAAMTVTEGALTFTARVIQAGDVLATRKGHTAQLSIPLEAPDPRRYDPATQALSTGLPSTTGGRRLPLRAPFRIVATRATGVIVATNAGTTDTPPIFTVAGPCPPFAITHQTSGRTIRYRESVAAGRTVVIDTAARTALLDGIAPRYVTGAWFTYAPGDNTVGFTADSYDATARLTSTHRSAWL